VAVPDRISCLRQVPLFAQISESNLRRVAEIAREVTFPRGSLLARLGQPGRAFIYIITGEALVRTVQNRHWRPVGYLRADSSFGATSLLVGEPHDATVQAMTDINALVIDRADFSRLLAQVPTLEEQLFLTEELERKLHNERFPWLGPNEVVILVVRRHWFLLLRSLLLPTLILALLGAALVYLGSLAEAWSWVPAVIVTATIYASIVIFRWFDWRNDYLAVTTERTVHREFVLAHLDETQHAAPLNMIQNVTVNAGFFGNLLGYGNIAIETAAQTHIGQILFDHASGATGFKDVVFQQIERAQARNYTSGYEQMRRELKQRLGWMTIEEIQARNQATTPPPPAAERPARASSGLVEALKRLRPFPPLRLVEGSQITWRKHWIFLLKKIWQPMLAGFIWLMVTIAAIMGEFPFITPDRALGVALGLVLLLAGIVLWFLWEYIDWENDIYILTDERIVDVEKKPFFFAEHRREATLDRIQNVNTAIPGPLAALLHYGNVDIDTAGEEGIFTFTHVVEPAEVTREIMTRVVRQRESRAKLEEQQRRREIVDWVTTYEALRREHESKPPGS